MNETSKAVHLPLACRREYGPRSEKQDALKEHVIEDVEQRRRQRKSAGGAQAGRIEGEGKTETDEDQTNILDGAVCEDALQIGLHQRVKNTYHCSSAASGQDGDSPPPSGRTEEIEDDADKAVDRNLSHDTAHQRRDVAWCGGMSKGQPNMERNKPRL